MDTTTNTIFNAFCRECASVKTVDLTEYPRVLGSDFGYCFYQATALESIYGALDMSNVTSASFAFFCGALVDVEFVPNTINASLRFISANLSDVSINSLVGGLVDLTDGTAKALELSGALKNRLTERQMEDIYKKNWTIVVK